MRSTELTTSLLLFLVAAAHGSEGTDSSSGDLSTSLHLAVYKLEPSQGLRLGSQQTGCELDYDISSPQYAVYLGTAERAGGLRQSRHCASSETCKGSFLSATGTLDLILASTVFVPEDFGSFQVALRLSGSDQCNQGGLQMAEGKPLDKKLLEQLQAAGRAAELAANPRWQEVLQQPVAQFPVDPPGAASIKESAQLLAGMSVWGPKVTLKTFPNGMRGLQATESIKQGSILMLFPFAKSIKLDNNSPKSPLPKLIPDHVWEAHFWRQYPYNAAVVLLHEMSKGAKSSMHKYLCMLPKAVDMPWQWSEKELDEMQVDNMKGMAADQYQRLSAVWHVLNSSEVSMPNLTWEKFYWACNIISSRSFGMDSLEGLANPRNRLLGLVPRPGLSAPDLSGLPLRVLENSSTPAHFVGLLPGVDLFNHQALLPQPDIYMSQPGQPGQWTWKKPLDRFVRISAAADLLPGQEIFISYGSKPNAELLGGYGFLVPGNIWDVYLLRNFTAQLAEASATRLLAPFVAASSHLESLAESVGVPSVGALGVNADDLTRLQDALQPLIVETEALKSGMAVQEHAATASWKLLGQACRQELAWKATTLEEDEATLTLALLATAAAAPFQPGTGLLPTGNLLTSDYGGPYNLTLLPVQANEIKTAMAQRGNYTDADIVNFLTNVECLEGRFDSMGALGLDFNDNLTLGGPLSIGYGKANLSPDVTAALAEVAVSEQGHALFTRHAGGVLPCPLVNYTAGFNDVYANIYGLAPGQDISILFGAPFSESLEDG
ncbi:hypothetical protein WJX84_012138 [Apatococcus fuscideae]|uniref:SET domain-containing protein n=1 Tax=Apatococcus fuscideae TaxID=2026836 RepID=A0AAW1RZB4_9CHLO